MPLASNLFKDNKRLNDCLVRDPAHVKLGDTGEHVRLIHIALKFIDGLAIDEDEIKTRRYGRSTAAAVLAYKKKRTIINRSYQSTEDNIVGKMTIAALDRDMRDREYVGTGRQKLCLKAGPGFTAGRRRPSVAVD